MLSRTIKILTILLLFTVSPNIIKANSLYERAEQLNKTATTFSESGEKEKAIEIYFKIIDMYEKEGKSCHHHSHPLDAIYEIGTLYGISKKAVQHYEYFDEKCPSKRTKLKLQELRFELTLDKEVVKLYSQAKELKKELGRDYESYKKLIGIYDKIIDEFPQSKATPYILFLKGREYSSMITRIYVSKNTRNMFAQKAIKAFKKIVTQYPSARFPFDDYYYKTKGHLIAARAQLAIADLLKSHYFPTPDIPQAIKEYRELIKNYPHELDDAGNKIIFGAYIQIMNLNPKEAKNICLKLLNEYPNEKFLKDNGSTYGETHPEAMLALAKMEEDKEKAKNMYLHMIENYNDMWTGQSGTCGSGSYASQAAVDFLNMSNDYSEQIQFFEDILKSDTTEEIKSSAGYQLLNIGISYKKEQTVSLYKRLIKLFPDEKEILQRKMENFTEEW